MKKLTLQAQGELLYTISPTNKPRLYIDSGDTVQIETEDAFSGQIRGEGDRRNLESVPYGNPQSGPIFVNGAKKGDAIAVTIQDIQPLIGQGSTRIVSFWYTARYDTQLIDRFLDYQNAPHGTKICPIRDGKVLFDNIELPYRPNIGTIATADASETYLAWLPGQHGGNMDLVDITTGARLYLPVRVDGALLHLGDVHAIQGEGELSGGAVEMPSLTTLKIDLVKSHWLDWPRLETDDMLYSIAATSGGRSLEDAMRIGFLDLALWLERDYSIDRWLAFELLTMVSKVSVGNFWTAAVGVPKRYLKRYEKAS